MIFKKLKDSFQSSLWITPSLIGLFGICLAFISLYFDQTAIKYFGWDPVKKSHAQSFFTFLTSMLAVLAALSGILFSIFMTLLAQATSQYGPLVLRVYKRSIITKLMIGLLVGSFLFYFSILTTAALRGSDSISFITMGLCGLLMGLVVITIPIFVQAILGLLKPTEIASQISDELEKSIKQMEQENKKLNQLTKGQTQQKKGRAPYPNDYSIKSPKDGYIVSKNRNKLIQIGKEENSEFNIRVQSGMFILKNNPLLFYKSHSKLNEEKIKNIIKTIDIDKDKAPIDDIEFYLMQLIGIIIHALSPGINDLDSAVKGIDYIGRACNLLLNKEELSGIYIDDDSIVRLHCKEFSFKGFIQAAFRPLRQNSLTQPFVAIHVLDILIQLIKNSDIEVQKKILLKEAEELVAASKEKWTNKSDINELDSRMSKITATS